MGSKWEKEEERKRDGFHVFGTTLVKPVRAGNYPPFLFLPLPTWTNLQSRDYSVVILMLNLVNRWVFALVTIITNLQFLYR